VKDETRERERERERGMIKRYKYIDFTGRRNGILFRILFSYYSVIVLLNISSDLLSLN